MSESISARILRGIATPDAKRAYNERLFTRVASKYDFVTRALSLGRDGAWKRDLIRSLPDLHAPRCVDLACGTGDLARLLAQRYRDGDILGIDLTPSMIEAARRRATDPNVRFQQGDMGALPLPDAWADVVTGGYALRNAPDLPRVLAEIRRVLKPGGVAAFLDFSKPVSPRGQTVELALLMAWGCLWGQILHRDPDTYAYIAESLRQFPDRDALRRLCAQHGLEPLRRRAFYFGVVECLILRKRAD